MYCLDDLADQRWVTASGLLDNHVHGNFGADMLSMNWAMMDWTMPGPRVRVGSLYSSMVAWPVQVRELLREISRDDDGYAGFLVVHCAPGGFGAIHGR